MGDRAQGVALKTSLKMSLKMSDPGFVTTQGSLIKFPYLAELFFSSKME